jgi:hypothetical protein
MNVWRQFVCRFSIAATSEYRLDKRWRPVIWGAILSVLLAFFVLALVSHNARASSPGAAPVEALPDLSSATPTPIPWNDIRVDDLDNYSVLSFDESLAIVANRVYITYEDNTWPGRIHLSKSTDSGRSFAPSQVVIVSDNIIHSLRVRAGADPGGAQDTLYVVYNEDLEPDVDLIKSTDGGATFLPPTLIYHAPDNHYIHSPKLAVTDDGTIYVSWGKRVNEIGGYFHVSKSTDGGQSFSPPVQIQTELTHVINSEDQDDISVRGATVYVVWKHFPQSSQYSDILLTKSTDGGITWSVPVRVNDVRFQWDMGQDAMMDPQGVIHVAWQDWRDPQPDRVRIYYSRSTDDGASFSPSVRVDDAVVGLVVGEPAIGSDGGLAAIHVAWADGRNYYPCEPCWFNDLFYAFSRDGGQTFSPNAQISDPIPENQIYGLVALEVAGGQVFTLWPGLCLPGQCNGEHIWLDIGPYQPPPGPTATLPPPTALPTVTSTAPAPTATSTWLPTTTPTRMPTTTPAAGQQLYLPLVLKGG